MQPDYSEFIFIYLGIILFAVLCRRMEAKAAAEKVEAEKAAVEKAAAEKAAAKAVDREMGADGLPRPETHLAVDVPTTPLNNL